ncbi:MAG: HAMP domain-containing histidine kinase [Actinomycetota bacterium]|nr:HAMP domain-containing histidine kinase [Actinomycetota bacterium]
MRDAGRRIWQLVSGGGSWALDAPTHQPVSGVVLAGLAISVLVCGVLDYITGPLISLVLFYIVPTAVGTMLGGRRAGLAIAVESAIVSIVAGLVGDIHDEIVIVANGLLLLGTLALITVVMAAVRDSALAARTSARRGREFLAYAAHQLRTPLAGIRASTDALLVGGATSQQERLLVNLSQEADRAGRLLSSLLKMARVDQGEVAALTPHDVVDLCRLELDRLAPRAGRLALDLIVAEAPPGPVLLSGEATTDALANLLDNARRHARDKIVVTVTSSASTIEIAVSDDGPGLPPGSAEEIFGRFVSLDGEGGTGLGLPIARGLIEAQGGRLSFDNNRFVIRLPHRRPT